MTTVADLTGEIEAIHNTLAKYAEDVEAYVFDPGSNPYPELDPADLKIDVLLTYAQTQKDSMVDFSAGAITTTIYKVAGTLREIGMRAQTKAMLYDLAVGRAGTESSEIRAESAKTLSDMKAKSPTQEEGI